MYFAEFIFEMAALFIDFTHHLHMLLWGNIFLSMASLVICMQLRYLFYEMQRRVKKHKNYLRVVRHMERNYSMALPEELESNSDDCAICWDKMESARKLPCGHLFHNSCLRSWLEQDTSCPTCRTALSDQHDQETNEPLPNNENILAGLGTSLTTPDATSDVPQNRERAIRNHFFHFDGSRYVSWLPSFSVEVTHAPLLRDRQQVQTSQLDSMARQVQQMFSHMPLNVITNDLRITRSIEVTIENILEERLVAPPFQMQTNRTNSQISSSSDSTGSVSEPDKIQESATLFSGDVPNAENITEEVQSSFGGRFSKSSEERERMLTRRKEEMIQAARK
uniref:RING-type domain-containing protein n=1 Tax=Strigamia maritima TaxID=126957 RepID=T1ISV8_STRMM